MKTEDYVICDRCYGCGYDPDQSETSYDFPRACTSCDGKGRPPTQQEIQEEEDYWDRNFK